MLIRGFWRLSSPSQNSGGKSLSAFVWALCLVSFGVQYSYFLVLQLQDIAEKMMVVFTFVPQLVCKFLLTPNGVWGHQTPIRTASTLLISDFAADCGTRLHEVALIHTRCLPLMLADKVPLKVHPRGVGWRWGQSSVQTSQSLPQRDSRWIVIMQRKIDECHFLL